LPASAETSESSLASDKIIRQNNGLDQGQSLPIFHPGAASVHNRVEVKARFGATPGKARSGSGGRPKKKKAASAAAFFLENPVCPQCMKLCMRS
jgi:hypothetical protein